MHRLGQLATYPLIAIGCVAAGMIVVYAEVAALGLAVLAIATANLLWLPRSRTITAIAIAGVLLPSLHPSVRPPAASTLRWGALALFLLIAIVGRARDPSGRGQSHSAHIHIAWIVIFALVSVLWSEGFLLTVGRSVAFAVMVAAVALYSRRGIEDLTINLLLRQTAIAVAVLNTIAFVAGLVGPLGRYGGVFGNPNTLGVINALLLPASFPDGTNHLSRRQKVLAYAVPALLIVQLVLAGSRGGLLAAGVGILMMELRRARFRERTLRLLGVGLAISAAVLIAPRLLVERLNSVDTRSSLWGLAPDLWRERPVVGGGFGVTERLLGEGAATVGFLSDVNFHNSYLNLLIDLGVVGVALFVPLLVVAIRRSRRHSPQLGAVVAAGAASALFESWMFSAGSGAASYFWLALAACLRPLSREVPEVPESDPALSRPASQARSFSPRRL